MRIKVGGSISSNHGEMLLDFARLGVGIVRLAEFHIGDDLRKGTLATCSGSTRMKKKSRSMLSIASAPNSYSGANLP